MTGTYLVHIKEAECLGKRSPVGSGVQKLDLRRHFPKHSIQTHFGQCSVGNWAFCRDNRTSGKGKTLNNSNELLGIDCE